MHSSEPPRLTVNAIEVQNLNKVYRLSNPWDFFSAPHTVRALSDISMTLEEGEICCLLGPNGAGKTTLLKIIADLVRPDQGEVFLFGKPLSQLKSEERSWMSWMAGEEKSFYWRLTGRQNLEFFATLYNLPMALARSKIAGLSELLGLDSLNKMYQEYSTGHRQRLAMIRALMVGAKLILMDEPTRSLDPDAAIHFQSLIRNQMASENRTILMATHNLREAEALADRVAILVGGRIRAMASISDIKTQRWPSLEVFYHHHTRV